jgi:hypothetical protein
MEFENRLAINISTFESIMAYKELKFAKTVELEEGTFVIEKVKLEINPEALELIQKMLLSGDIWVKQGKSDFAAVGIEKKNVKHILKHKVVDGREVYKEIHGKKVRELSEEEVQQLTILIQSTIATLKLEQNGKPSHKTEVERLRSTKPVLTKSPIIHSDRRESLPTKKAKEQILSQGLSQHTILENSKQRKRKRDKVAQEKKEKARRIDEEAIEHDLGKWEIKTSEIKREGIEHPHKKRKIK